jgi:hypothetical protein
MAVKQASLADNLQAIIDKAPGLRAAGVTSVGGEVPFTLAPAPVREGKQPRRPAEIGSLDDFRKDADDPAPGGDS